MKPIRDWFYQTFSDPQVMILTSVLLVALAAIIFVAEMVAPVITAVVIAFLLDGPVQWMKRRGVGHLLAVILAFTGFVAAMLVFMLVLLPVIIEQVFDFVGQAPQMTQTIQEQLLALPEQFPGVVSEEQVRDFMGDLGASVLVAAASLPSFAGASIVGLLKAIVFAILVLLLIFFMVKDKKKITAWVVSFLPRERELTTMVWSEVRDQVYNYVRGKFWEILIVGGVSYVVFAALGLDFAMLLAVITGLSVLIPYIGAAAVTVPVALVAFVQWGLSWDFGYALIAYGIIQALDGNLLAPLLFSEVVNLHPIAIIVAILIFGGLWGLWGVFFAIPLATVVQAVLRAWPRSSAWRKPI
ncbi:MAG: AI-2E family transporter [Rhodospirillaceae bacterium]|nr:AI-2E family transporter [Rhodospirillaceae bacterium]|tara:strand:+ start:1415 stop:2479 length:1065 start_codon:yes stop_codon:yes gene_type:complete